jgi:ribosomal protein RSM22 (predicted rRNA methylase)
LASELPFAVNWNLSGFSSWQPTRKYDLVIASYALGEISSAERRSLVSSAWESTSAAFVIIEPGTRRGFSVVAEIRDQLIASGAAIAAPCPHALPCPMRSQGDWCHFSVRVERSAQHRQLKQAELGFEDEKFSYVVATRMPAKPAVARIVRHPLRLTGHVKLQLCTSTGLSQQTVTRSQKESYRAVKKADWGSSWNR